MSWLFASGGQRYWSFSFIISPSNEYSGLISVRKDLFDLLAAQGTLKSLLQHCSSKASILRCSVFFRVQPAHPYMTTGKTSSFYSHIFLGSKITADDDCSHEIKRCLLLRRKAMTNLDSILKSRDIAGKGPSSQSCGFSSSHVWM